MRCATKLTRNLPESGRCVWQFNLIRLPQLTHPADSMFLRRLHRIDTAHTPYFTVYVPSTSVMNLYFKVLIMCFLKLE